MKTINIRGNEYVPVSERLKEFRKQFKGYRLCSTWNTIDANVAICIAEIRDADGNLIATGTAMELSQNGMINKTSHVENCETSAWGRALANFGIGIDSGVASAEEMQKVERTEAAQQHYQAAAAQMHEPTELEVSSYAVQKGYSGAEAMNFYKYASGRGWRTATGEVIKDWKKYLDSWMVRANNK